MAPRPAIAHGAHDVVVASLGFVPTALFVRTGGDEPKTPGLTGHPTDGTLVGHLGLIARGSDVIVAQGVIDSLTAALAWPDAAVHPRRTSTRRRLRTSGRPRRCYPGRHVRAGS